MQFKPPKNNDRYFWTGHALGKMQYYGLSPQRILRVINNPQRKEEGVAENTTAVMQPASVNRKDGSWHAEIWAMYQLETRPNDRPARMNRSVGSHSVGRENKYKIISAWRYPGVSPSRNAIPEEIMEEVKDLL